MAMLHYLKYGVVGHPLQPFTSKATNDVAKFVADYMEELTKRNYKPIARGLRVPIQRASGSYAHGLTSSSRVE